MSNLSVLTTPKTGVPKEEFSTIPGIEADPRFKEFLSWERASRDAVDFKKVYADVAGDLIAGLLLSQIIYWNLPDKEGKTKLRVKKGGVLCLAKTRHGWWDEIRFKPTQADKGLKILREKGIIKTEVYRFHNIPTTHIFLQQKTLIDLLTEEVNNPKKNPNGVKSAVQ